MTTLYKIDVFTLCDKKVDTIVDKDPEELKRFFNKCYGKYFIYIISSTEIDLEELNWREIY